MRALLLYDETSQDFEGVNLAKQVETSIQKAGFTVKSIKITGSEFKPCMGCFGCWVKTPGLCVLPGDKVNQINNDVVNSQLLVILTHVLYGCYSADTKKYIDRIIPIVSPFFTIIDDEMHHKKRYDNYPNLIGVGYGADITENEKHTFKTLIHRNSINFHSPKSLALVIGDPKDVSMEINSLSVFLLEVLS